MTRLHQTACSLCPTGPNRIIPRADKINPAIAAVKLCLASLILANLKTIRFLCHWSIGLLLCRYSGQYLFYPQVLAANPEQAAHFLLKSAKTIFGPHPGFAALFAGDCFRNCCSQPLYCINPVLSIVSGNAIFMGWFCMFNPVSRRSPSVGNRGGQQRQDEMNLAPNR